MEGIPEDRFAHDEDSHSDRGLWWIVLSLAAAGTEPGNLPVPHLLVCL